MEENRLEDTYESESPIVRKYFRTKVWAAIKLANLKKDDVILDFGCGGGWLEKKLKNFNVLGYDINPQKTFIKDYMEVKPTKIFCLDVFEHIPIEEIKEIIKNFNKMSNQFELIVSLPTENWISKKIRKLLGKAEVPKEHITRYYDVIRLLNENFKLKKKINFVTVSYILKYKSS